MFNINDGFYFVKGVYTENNKGKIIEMKFSQYLEIKFLEWQQSEGGRKTVRQFAAYIGVSPASITQWWNENRVPEGENIQKLANKLGVEVYDVLGLPRPNENLYYLQKEWDSFSLDEQKRIRDFANNLKYGNEENAIRQAQVKRKPRSTD